MTITAGDGIVGDAEVALATGTGAAEHPFMCMAAPSSATSGSGAITVP
jgi:hypothetical protein